jgi:hypothetical protein
MIQQHRAENKRNMEREERMVRAEKPILDATPNYQ